MTAVTFLTNFPLMQVIVNFFATTGVAGAVGVAVGDGVTGAGVALTVFPNSNFT